MEAVEEIDNITIDELTNYSHTNGTYAYGSALQICIIIANMRKFYEGV